MIEKLTCPVCGQTIQSDKTYQFEDSKSVTCNECKLKSQLGQWRVAADRPVEVLYPPQINSQPPLRSQRPISVESLQNRISRDEPSIVVQPSDVHVKIALWIGALGLLLACLSPFFKWVSVGAGGMTGLAGDGKILLVITIFAAIAFFVSIARKNLMLRVLLPVQLWGILVAFWMGGLLWKLSSFVTETDKKENLFAAMLSTMLVSPGVGLYMGLIGGIFIAGALGYVTATQFSKDNKFVTFVAFQAIALSMGIGIAVFFGPSGFPKSARTSSASSFGFGATQLDKETLITAELRKSFKLGNLEITPIGVQLRTLNERPRFGEKRPRKTKSFVFSFSAKNISEGEVFQPFTTSKVTDNFENKCSDPTNDETFSSSVILDSNEILKKIGPGETATVMIAFDPQIETAKEYVCTLSTNTSNKDDYKKWQFKFSPSVTGGN